MCFSGDGVIGSSRPSTILYHCHARHFIAECMRLHSDTAHVEQSCALSPTQFVSSWFVIYCSTDVEGAFSMLARNGAKQ